MEFTELNLAKEDILEENHLLVLFNKKEYRGWYKYSFVTPVSMADGTIVDYHDLIIRYRMTPALKVYNKVRIFSDDERKIGIHRMLIGQDLNEIEDGLKINDFKSVEEINQYLESLDKDDFNSLLNRAKKVITFDCNKIPYLQIRTKIDDEDKILQEQKDIIDKYIFSHPDYLNIYTKVLDEKIDIATAKEQSKGLIYNEFLELQGE